MPKNKIGGKGAKKGKNISIARNTLIEKDTDQEYAQVLKMLGSGRIRLQSESGLEMVGIIRGKMYKRTWIGVGDLVLISNREFQRDKADVIHKYSADDIRSLKLSGSIPDSFDITGNQECGDDFFEFTHEASTNFETNTKNNDIDLPSSGSEGELGDIDDI
jgi:translation initiation factor 1A